MMVNAFLLDSTDRLNLWNDQPVSMYLFTKNESPPSFLQKLGFQGLLTVAEFGVNDKSVQYEPDHHHSPLFFTYVLVNYDPNRREYSTTLQLGANVSSD